VNFASNTLNIAVAPGYSKKIASSKGPTQQGLNVVVSAPQVPCGSATRKVEQASHRSEVEPGERRVLGFRRPEQGDNRSGRRRTGLRHRVGRAVNTYPIAVLKGSKNPELARKFVDLVTGESGQKVLSVAGFARP